MFYVDHDLYSLVHDAQLPMYAPVDGNIESTFIELATIVVQVNSRKFTSVTGDQNRQHYWESTQVIVADRL